MFEVKLDILEVKLSQVLSQHVTLSTGFWFLFVYYPFEIISLYPLGYYIGEIGCNTYDVFLNAIVGFVQSQSFFMALYRYLCIIHCEFLDSLEISGKVSGF